MNFIRENILKIVTFIVILVVIIIVFSFVFKGTGSSKANTYAQMEENLKNAAQRYATKNTKVLPKSEKEQSMINTDTLVNAEYIKELYSIDDENVKCSGYVLISKNGDSYTYIPHIKCGKYYETKTIADYIETNEQLATADDGLYKYGEKYVYRGENPKNFLKMGEKLYRIIEITEDNELKLISTTKYQDSFVWDDRYNIEKDRNYGINDYAKSRLKEGLEEVYKSDYFTEGEKSIIIPHSICIGKRYLDDQSIDGKTECATVYPDQKVSLINVSEYMRASLDSNCTNATSESCSNYNYFENISSYLKTITAVADNTYQIYKINYGIADASNASTTVAVYPVVYIDKNTLYAAGDGTEENPYTVR